MLIKLNLQSDVPIYTQIVQMIVLGIASGQLKPGDPLPSVRSLAADVGINLHTVNKAYQLLKQDGYIQIHRQKGVVVHPDGMPEADEAFCMKVADGLRPLIAESVCRNMNEQQFLSLCHDLFREVKGTDKEEDFE